MAPQHQISRCRFSPRHQGLDFSDRERWKQIFGHTSEPSAWIHLTREFPFSGIGYEAPDPVGHACWHKHASAEREPQWSTPGGLHAVSSGRCESRCHISTPLQAEIIARVVRPYCLRG